MGTYVEYMARATVKYGRPSPMLQRANLQGKKWERIATMCIVPYAIIVDNRLWSISVAVMLLQYLSACSSLAKSDEMEWEMAFSQEQHIFMVNARAEFLRSKMRLCLSSGLFSTLVIFLAVLHFANLTWLHWCGAVFVPCVLAQLVFWTLPTRIFGDAASAERLIMGGTTPIHQKRSTVGPAIHLWWTLTWPIFKLALLGIMFHCPGGKAFFLAVLHEPCSTPTHVFVWFWALVSILHPVLAFIMFYLASRGFAFPGLSFDGPLQPPFPNEHEAGMKVEHVYTN